MGLKTELKKNSQAKSWNESNLQNESSTNTNLELEKTIDLLNKSIENLMMMNDSMRSMETDQTNIYRELANLSDDQKKLYEILNGNGNKDLNENLEKLFLAIKKLHEIIHQSNITPTKTQNAGTQRQEYETISKQLDRMTKLNSSIKNTLSALYQRNQKVTLENEQMQNLSDGINDNLSSKFNDMEKKINDIYIKLEKTNEFNKGIGKLIITSIAFCCVALVTFMIFKGGLTIFEDISDFVGLTLLMNVCVEKASENSGFFKFTWSTAAFILYILRFIIVIVMSYFGFSFAGKLFDKKRQDLDY